jgi:polyisoprenoid-binding protein YceI
MFLMLVSLLIAEHISEPSLIWMMVALAALNVFLAQLSFFKDPIRSLIPILVSIGGFIFLQSELTYSHFNDEYALINKFTLAGVFIASFLPLIVVLKDKVLKNIVKLEIEGATKATTIVLMTIVLFLAHFGAGFIGVLLISSILIAVFAYSDEEFEGPQITPLILVYAGHYALASNIEMDVLQVDILFGLLLGAFFVYLFSLVHSKTGILLLVISLLLGFGALLGVVYAGSMHPSMGGLDAALALLVGAAIAGSSREEIFSSTAIASISIALLIAAPFQSDQEEQDVDFEVVTTKVSDTEPQEKIEIELDDITDLIGDYKINSDSSSVTFVMGKKGETKGAFRTIEGAFHFEENVGNVSAKVELDLDNFTTFNKMRDKSLMGSDYFRQDEFPGMTYKAKGLSKMGDNTYELSGEFTMLGSSMEQKVSLMKVKSDGAIWLIGDGEIDRTKYGMSPSATEGNVVMFSYKVLLNP